MNFSKTYQRTGICRPAIWLFALFMLSTGMINAQARLETPIRMKIEDGNTDGVNVVLKNVTTGETNSVSGESKFSLSLKLNCDYIISFTKPGYVTKKIQVNTTMPDDRASQGLYPFPFDVYLFKQYEGVNIVVFNQPVGRITYSKAMDEFDYDTDYTKQVQSQIAEVEAKMREKAKEAKANEKQLARQEAELKKQQAEEARNAAKLQAAEDKKAAAEARAAEDARLQAEKQAELDRRKAAQALADAEKARQTQAVAASEQHQASTGASGAEAPATHTGGTGADQPQVRKSSGSGDEPLAVVSQAVSNEDPTPPGGYHGTGLDSRAQAMADAHAFQDDQQELARVHIYQDNRPATLAGGMNNRSHNGDLAAVPEIKVEEITEVNRNITRVTIHYANDAVVYRRVVYRWGGVYFFRNDRPISESLFLNATAQR